MNKWILTLIIILVFFLSYARADDFAEQYTVKVMIDQKGKFTLYNIHSFNDSSALTYVEAEMRLNKFISNVQNVIVEKTGLDFAEVPTMEFEIVGSKGERIIPLHTYDSRLGILAIQHALTKNLSHITAGIGEVQEIRVTDEFLFAENHPSECSSIF